MLRWVLLGVGGCCGVEVGVCGVEVGVAVLRWVLRC